MSFYETVAWNYFEVEARYQKARERAAGFYEMDFKDIDSPREWARAFKTFGIPHRLPAIFQKTKERHQSIFDDKAKLLALGHLKERWAEPELQSIRKRWLKF